MVKQLILSFNKHIGQKKKLVIVAIGKFNVALAIEKDPAIKEKIDWYGWVLTP